MSINVLWVNGFLLRSRKTYVSVMSKVKVHQGDINLSLLLQATCHTRWPGSAHSTSLLNHALEYDCCSHTCQAFKNEDASKEKAVSKCSSEVITFKGCRVSCVIHKKNIWRTYNLTLQIQFMRNDTMWDSF